MPVLMLAGHVPWAAPGASNTVYVALALAVKFNPSAAITAYTTGPPRRSAPIGNRVKRASVTTTFCMWSSLWPTLLTPMLGNVLNKTLTASREVLGQLLGINDGRGLLLRA